MVRIRVGFWLCVLVWVAVLFLVFPRSGEWAIQRGRLSCSTAAVHPASGVSVVYSGELRDGKLV